MRVGPIGAHQHQRKCGHLENDKRMRKLVKHLHPPPPLFTSRHKLSANDQQNSPAHSYIHAIPHPAVYCKGHRHVLRELNISIPTACSVVLVAFSICCWPHLQMPASRAFQSVEHPCCDLSLVAGCRPEEGPFLATWKQ